MAHWGRNTHARLMCGAAMLALLGGGGVAAAEEAAKFNIAPQPLASALNEFAVQSPWPILYTTTMTGGKMTAGVKEATDPEVALNTLLEGTGLGYRREGETFLIVRADDPQSGSAAGDGAEGTVEALIVTAQKREEDIQDVPIAISAFTQESLERSQIAGGPDLMTQIPNMTFTKTNFSSYSIQIRGIGTQAISATTDPAVAIAFNNTPFVRNRFFEQEFYDLQRVEVLRGPQGTLYGRNATAGVVNIISAKPKFAYEAKLSADVANYNSTRLEGMVNVPLVEDVVALRLAGAWTKREGYSTNEITGNPIDGRDLWSTRLSLRFAPTDRIDATLIWEHFEEDDDRLRSGKQLCHKHTVTELVVPGVDGQPGRVVTFSNPYQAVPDRGQFGGISTVQSVFSQGCLPGSLYAPEAFQTPNGQSIPYYYQLGAIGLPIALPDPYVSEVQSPDLRIIESTVDPEYRAKSDVLEFQVAVDLTDTLSLASETAWASDFIFSTQDFNRFNTSSGAWSTSGNIGTRAVNMGVLKPGPNGPVYCDPQIGCADRLVAVDLSTAKSQHFSQELRLGSDFDGPFNFSLGANFLRYDTVEKYYVFINSIGMIAALSHPAAAPYVSGVTDNADCLMRGLDPPDLGVIAQVGKCTYIDPNPIGSLNDQGHNYFLSKNPYKLISYAVFGETYYNITENLKLTGGLRWTVDKKQAPRNPSWILGSQTAGHPVHDVIEQEWREPTGRLSLDWKPDLGFTDETLLYASAARGYKAGGANPPPPGPVMYCGECRFGALQEAVVAESATHPKTFDAEFVNAFELGAKNTMLDGGLTLNLAAFYYDYTAYQISQIINRSAVNYNFDATVWGLEIEADWRPLENLKLGFKGGYENTRIADGEKAIDIMDRTAGMPGWSVVRPFPTFPSNCILPTELYVPEGGTFPFGGVSFPIWGLGGPNGGNPGGCEHAYVIGNDPGTEQPFGQPANATGSASGFWRPGTYPGFDPATAPNGGEGFDKELGGNELPNAPNFTATITADYTVPLPSDWLMTLHTDLYYQSEAWTRVFNTEGYDKLKAYTNVNLAAIFTNEEAGWKVMAYVKNVFDRDSITGAFLNSDDTGLTTNVFLTEPRLFGLRVTKEWNGGPWWTGANPNHTGPYPLTVELGGQVQRHDAPFEIIRPGFADQFSPAIDIFGEEQDQELDWGDGREVRIAYRPASGPWAVRAGYRHGETNAATRRRAEEPGDEGCATRLSRAAQFCYPGISPGYTPAQIFRSENSVDSAAVSHEEHQMIEFAVFRDVGLGMASGLSTTLGMGVRHGSFESTTSVTMDGRPNWDIPEFDAARLFTTFNRHQADYASRREFEGAGPVVTWEADYNLLGNDETGHLALDWSVTGGVLFGKQQTEIEGQESSALYSGKYLAQVFTVQGTPSVTPVSIEPRTNSVSVPLVDLSLGLSYEARRFKIGAGYRWERYFDVLDAGYEEKRDVDRTLDGPYFKLAVGFGG